MGKELHKPLDRKSIEPVAHQFRHVRLQDAKLPGSLGLGQFALADDSVHLHRKLHLELALFRVRVAEIGEDVSASGLHFNPLLCHSAPDYTQ